jgi:citrate synthase
MAVSRTCPKLFQQVANRIPEVLNEVNILKKSKAKIADLKISHILGGLRGLPVLNSFTSELHYSKGPMIHGIPLPELIELLPQRNSVPIPEAMFWFQLSGQIPSLEDTYLLIDALDEKSALPNSTILILDSLPNDFPPINLLSIGILSLNNNSKFNEMYEHSNKSQLWEGTYEDALDILAKMTSMLGYIYCKRHGFEADLSIRGSMSSRFCRTVGGENSLDLLKFIRLFLTIYADNDSGSASAHVSKLIGSTLSDPYKAISGAINAVGGHLHGRAMQDSIEWIIKSSTFYQTQVIQDIKDGKAIPGFGHAKLNDPDPRYEIIRNYFKAFNPNHPMLKRVEEMAQVIPTYLKGKVRDPHINGEFIAGACLHSLGIEDSSMGPCLFGLARTLGCLSNLVWDRACYIPIEYTNTVDLDFLEKLALSNNNTSP